MVHSNSLSSQLSSCYLWSTYSSWKSHLWHHFHSTQWPCQNWIRGTRHHTPKCQNLQVKYGFFKKLFLYEWTSDQLNNSWTFFFIKIRFSCNQNIGETLTQCKKCLSNVLITGESNLMKEVVKKCSTDQSFILTEITS